MIPGLRDILEAATPPRPIPEWWSDTRLQQTAIAQARLSALAPELAALALDMGEELRSLYHSPGEINYMPGIPPLFARLDRLGKEPSDG